MQIFWSIHHSNNAAPFGHVTASAVGESIRAAMQGQQGAPGAKLPEPEAKSHAFRPHADGASRTIAKASFGRTFPRAIATDQTGLPAR